MTRLQAMGAQEFDTPLLVDDFIARRFDSWGEYEIRKGEGGLAQLDAGGQLVMGLSIVRDPTVRSNRLAQAIRQHMVLFAFLFGNDSIYDPAQRFIVATASRTHKINE